MKVIVGLGNPGREYRDRRLGIVENLDVRGKLDVADVQ